MRYRPTACLKYKLKEGLTTPRHTYKINSSVAKNFLASLPKAAHCSWFTGHQITSIPFRLHLNTFIENTKWHLHIWTDPLSNKKTKILLSQFALITFKTLCFLRLLHNKVTLFLELNTFFGSSSRVFISTSYSCDILWRKWKVSFFF